MNFMPYFLVVLSVLCALCFPLVGAEEICLSVVHEQTSRQKTQTLHCQPSGRLSFIVLGEYNRVLLEKIPGCTVEVNVVGFFFYNSGPQKMI